jgi:adenylosuccinate lyase
VLERDISHFSVERVIMPDSTILIDYMLARLTSILKRLVVNADTMRRNMDASFGLFFSQRVLLALIEKGMDRQKAYELVQKTAMRCWNEQTPFPEAVRQDPDIAAQLDHNALCDLFNPAYYLRHEDAVFARVFGLEE